MESKKRNITLSALVNVCRFVLAAVFIFSGFVKANDPLGFQYKLNDYMLAFGISDWFPESVLMLAAVALATLEFMVGVYLLFGINRRLTSLIVVMMMGVMTPLTLYLALENPVSDCGCFGDAIILSNWQTFSKNVFLLVASIVVLCMRRRMFRFVTRRSEWLVSVNTLLYIIILSYYSLTHLPVFDFRPYSIGANIPEGMEIPEDAKRTVYETLFVMEKDGVRQEFALEDYPNSTWTLVERRTVVKEQGYEPPIHDFALQEMQTGEDITEWVLGDAGYTFLMVSPQLEKADDSYSDLLNELYDYCCRHGYAFYGLTASSEEMVEQWLDRTGGEYPFCNVDEIALKTMVRSNPGLLLIKEGVVLNKWANGDIPDEYQLTGALESLPLAQGQVKGKAEKIAICILWFVLPLMLISLLDYLYSRRRRNRLEPSLHTENEEIINHLIK